MINERFGRLIVISQGESRNWRTYWKCKCDCGKEIEVMGKLLRNGGTKSCGCLRGEKRGNQLRTHGMSESRIYNIWTIMKERCLKKYSTSYKNYGNRGIKICEEWLKFENFYKWSLENGYTEILEIDRINVNGNYEPNNCRWVTTKENANNRRNSRYITIEGITKTIRQWENEYNICPGTMSARVKSGWTGKKLLAPAIKGRNQYSTNIEEVETITISTEGI